MDAEIERPAPGSQIMVRDAVWLVRSVTETDHDGDKITAVGISGIVRDQEATFFTALDDVTPLRPEDTELIADSSEHCRDGRLFLEAVLRKTPLPQSERGLATVDGFLLNQLPYQRRPAEQALTGLRPRILIADVVGLGKTLEIGLALAELIRRGRGERILVVTPQQVLEQFQRELWTRFAIPLIRLDTVGIQRIQREIPAGRNPFTYYKRAIISIDTLKNEGRFGHHLDSIEWDAVVLDESHNLFGSRSDRSKLARRLAPLTDALLLASATPHNGDSRSFADLIDLLDPTAIADRNSYNAEDIAHLYIRRTKISPEVRDHVRDFWADRGPSVPIRAAASEAEERIFAELTKRWLAPGAQSHMAGDRRLFSYSLLKSFLSSHRALLDTVTNRLKTLSSSSTSSAEAERVALERLRDLAAELRDEDSAKLAALLERLRECGVGPRGSERVVVFSERVPTLKWLEEVVPRQLGLPAKAVRVLHGGVSDQQEQEYLNEFGLADSPVRLLFTGDLASEGVNLHQQCHRLIHYDLPWSLIRIEQRNGRIDRYGQTRSPEFAALVLTSATPGAKDDTTVAEKLLARESEAHESLGSAEAVTGLYSARKEEDRLVKDLLHGKSVEESLEEQAGPDVLSALLGEVGPPESAPPPRRAQVPALFENARSFTDEALRACYGSGTELGLSYQDEVLAMNPPPDLQRRLSVLPPDYLTEQRVKERMLLTFDTATAERHLRTAVDSGKTRWPRVGFASELHPVVEWLADKVLLRLGRQKAVVLRAEVEEPVFLIQGIYSNALGRPTVVRWMGVSGVPDAPEVGNMFEVLDQAGIGPTMNNPGVDADVAGLQKMLPTALAAARAHLEAHRANWDAEVAEPLTRHVRRVDRWEQLAFEGMPGAKSVRRVQTTADEQRRLVRLLSTDGLPFLRVLGVLVGGCR